MQLPTSEIASILDGMLEGFQVLGPGLRYLYLNETAARHGRSSKQALLGRTMAECYPGVEATPLYGVLLGCLDGGKALTMENEFAFPDGSTGWFELRIEPAPQGICVLSLDITARKRAEERLRFHQRMDAIGQLAAGIAHDFNNLLAVLIGHAELARTREDGPTLADIEAVLAAARMSSDLTKQLLAYGRRSVVTREAFDLLEVVAVLEPILRRALGERIELEISAPRTLERIEGDRVQLQQVIMNLVLNARDAIDDRGTISLGVEVVQSDDAGLAGQVGARSGRHVVLAVTDTGKGMDAATRERLFDPFFTTKRQGRGTGLGLATVFAIVRQHGGSIRVCSEPGAGSTFKVYLPVSGDAGPGAEAPPPVEDYAQPRRGVGAVLVAEDSALLRTLIEAVLVDAGYRVVLTAAGDAALARFEQEQESIGLLITDVILPGLHGHTLVERVRLLRPTLPVICTSGHSREYLVESGQLPRDVVFIAKPFAPHALLEHVRALLEPAEGR
jgi:two-component system cell cycle sensor histidine kinase/response regulator CckA